MLKNKYFSLFFFFFATPLLLNANTYSVNKNLYFGFNGGMIVPNDIEINKSVAGVVNGVTYSANVAGAFKFDSGYQLGGLIGYRLNDFLSLESELIFSNFDYDKVDVTTGGTATVGGTTFTGTANTSYEVDGSISAFSMIFGPNLDLDVREDVEFFIGGGVGFTNYNDEIKTVGGSTGLSYDEDFTDFTAKFKAGINYSISTDTFIQAEYGYNYVDSGIENYSDDFSANSFNAKIIFNF
jgi:opacity protein-like surface antigen